MKKIKIIIGICSHYGASERRETIRKTWLKHDFPRDEIEYRFFIGGGTAPEDDAGDIVVLDSPDTYRCLPRKCFDFYAWCFSNYDFDYLFKCDDDTYLEIARLPGLLDYGYGLIGDPSTLEENRLAPSGGAGYFLSRALVKDILDKGVPDTGCEDLIFGRLARTLGYESKADGRLCMYSSKMPLPDNDMASCHWCSVEEMLMIDHMYHSAPALILKAKHKYWEDNLLLYENGAVRREGSGDMAWLDWRGNGRLVVDWLKWKGEMMKEERPGFFEGKTLSLSCGHPEELKRIGSRETSPMNAHPRVAVCLTSYKRYDHLVRQVHCMLAQSYENKHLFVAVKGVSEYFFKSVVLPLFRKYIDDGALTMRHFPNKNQFSNFVDTVRDLDLEDYDLFFKIDDDDFYSPDYLKDCCAFHKGLPRSCSSYYRGEDYKIYVKNGINFTSKSTFSDMFGFSMVLSRKAMKTVLECEREPRRMHCLSQKWDGREGHHNYGFTEDHFFDIVMKEYGRKDRTEFIRENGIPLHIAVNKSTWSVTRATPAQREEEFRLVNVEVNGNPDNWEHILDLRHPHWESPCRVFRKKGIRLDNGEVFEVRRLDENGLIIAWQGDLVEEFTRTEDGSHVCMI